MNLGNIFRWGNQNVTQTDAAKTVGNVSTAEKNARISNEVRGMVPGQTIQGEVVAREGNTVQIALDSDTVLTARLERDLNIALGQNMSFEVKTNNGSLLSLTPLYANMANEATILKALSAAGLAVNRNNMQMVADMMKEGMSIDKDSIAYMSRQLADFPDAQPSSIMQLIRLGMPVTQSNIEQFEAYKNYEHQIVQSAQQIMEEVPQTFLELVSEGKDTEAIVLYGQIIRAFTEGGYVDSENAVRQEIAQKAETAGTMNGETAQTIKDASVPTQETIEAAPEKAVSDGETQGSSQTGGRLQTDGTQQTDGSQQADGTRQTGAALKEMPDILTQGAAAEETAQKEQAVKPDISPRVWQRLGDMMRKLGTDETTAKQIADGSLSPKETLTKIHDLLMEHPHLLREDFKEGIKQLFGSRAFQSLLQTEMTNQWTLKPEDVAQRENIEKLYERIREQTAKMNEAFQIAGKADTAGAKSVQNLQSNVDFMNQMNHLFTYVQLPLKMAGNQAHGDLYVYTNKKDLAKKDGNVSALLHLDMEHLGPLDVYVAMQKNINKVSTNFTLRDESSLDLIEKHIHILDERLRQRGYDVTAKFQIKEEDAPQETNIMQEILNQNKNISVLSKTSFDMRA